MSDKELKDKKASEKVQGIANPVDEEDLLVTNPPPPRSMNSSFKINSALSKSGTDTQYSSSNTQYSSSNTQYSSSKKEEKK